MDAYNHTPTLDRLTTASFEPSSAARLFSTSTVDASSIDVSASANGGASTGMVIMALKVLRASTIVKHD